MLIDQSKLEDGVQALGKEVFAEVSQYTLSVFNPEFYTGKLMEWAMKDEEFKVNLFRFVDVFPTLSSSSAVVRHAQEYFDKISERIPGILRWGLKVNPDGLSALMGSKLIGQQMRQMASKFIVGVDGKGSLKALREIRKNKFAFTVDLLGEATVSEEESLEYQQRYFELIETLGVEVPKWREARPLLDGHRGESTPVHISVKLSALYSQISPIRHNQSVTVLAERFSEILRRAVARKIYVVIDMEDSSMTSITLDVLKHVLDQSEFQSCDGCGVVLQAYMRRTENDLEELLKWIKRRGTVVPIRLVKGAYWDTETLYSRQRSWPNAVWETKSSTDANYEKLTLRLLENSDVIFPAFGSHNVRSLSYAIKAAEWMNVPRTHFELQALYGMAEPLKKCFVDRGFLVREYSPVGELLPGMSYLVRRLLENTSNEGFLRQGFYEHESVDKLLQKPELDSADTGGTHVVVNMRQEFVSVPNTDFSLTDNRLRLKQELDNLTAKIRSKPLVVKPLIEGQYHDSQRTISGIVPENTKLTISEVRLADKEMADVAVKKLAEFFPTWRETPVQKRAEVLFNAAELLEKKRTELISIVVLETGKPWVEADVELSEAIDFCNYYAHEAIKLSRARKMGNYPGEVNTLFYEPRGVTSVIAPWNFPIAIPCGMFAASLVMGNTTLLKPAEQSSLIASSLFETFLAAGLPEKAAAFIPGVGEEIGPVLVSHPLVSTIVFTGSKAVGLNIIQQASSYAQDKISGEHVKRVIAEMGGKNAIIVDEDADTDEAVRGVLNSAFNYAGQKCSACSRVIVVGSIYEKFTSRLQEGLLSLPIGKVSDPATTVGPVIDKVAYERLKNSIESAKRRAVILAEGVLTDQLPGYFIPPIIFTEIPNEDPLLREELFGPVLAVSSAKDFSSALKQALDSEYALTGAIFSRSPKNIEHAVRDFRVGNLYINRGSTGALVMRQPFGGFKMSGVGSKAGGPDYLPQFTVPRAISENSVRRGFAPLND